MTVYEAPGKINLSLIVSPPAADGYHPLESLVQTVEWCDRLTVTRSEEGSDILDSDIEDNLVEKALFEMRETITVPPLAMGLEKTLPVAAGMGGGSSDAAAALLAAADFSGTQRSELPAVAHRIGADVTLFLTGGSLMMRGVGYEIEPVEPFDDFAVAIVVPDFGMVTRHVYMRWDRLEGPVGPAIADDRLPPPLRGGMPMRNDLLPAALDLEPRLGDFMADLASIWGAPVSLTGSGSACFGYFATVDEAADATTAVDELTGEGRGVALRDHGVARVDDPWDENAP
jgi:4-diphosphocytidyl-2-C-methyl-D-erythritol kinase